MGNYTFDVRDWADGETWDSVAVDSLEARIKKSGPFVNVADYGAIGDGVGGNRDTAAFLEAAAILNATAGA